jgi:hypothetical protein
MMAVGGKGVFPNVAMNSVVEGGTDDEIYVTQFQNAAIPAGGVQGRKSAEDYLGRALHDLIELTAVAGLTGVHRCTLDVKAKTAACAWAVRGLVHANGLTISQDRSKLFVNEPARKEVRVYSRAGDGSLSELADEVIWLPHAVDNIHVMPGSGEIHAGSITRIWQILAKKPQEGSLLVGKPRPGGGYAWRDEMLHDATLMNGFSACIKSAAKGATWALCGSPKANGVLACSL